MNNTTPENPNSPVTGHPIKVVAQRTGLSPHVIRVWEKRYNAVTPKRTATNRRVYANRDIERLQLLNRATQSGRSIGQVADLTDDQLRDLIQQDAQALLPATPQQADIQPSVYIEAALKATEQLDARALYTMLSEAAVSLSQPRLIEGVIVPLMYQIGDRWRSGDLRVAHEHLAYAVVRGFLESLRATYAAAETAPRIIVATPSGQLHELGAIIASIIAASEGWQVTYLGSGLPAEEIASAARQKNVRAVALSLVYPGDDAHLKTELSRLRETLPANVAILIGGRVAANYRSIIQTINAFEVENIQNLRDQLQAVRSA